VTFINAQKTRVLVGALHASGYTQKVGNKLDVKMLKTTTLLDTSERFIVGQESSEFSLDMILDTDTTAGGQWSVGTTWKSTPAPFSHAPSGLTAGSEIWLAQANQAQFNMTTTHDGLSLLSCSTVNDGGMEPGTVISDITAITVDGNGASVDNGAATTNGCVWHLHVTGFTGLTSDVVVLEHSVDDSVWATLDTATTVTGLTSERRVVAPGTTVRRYLRIRDDVTGTGTCTRTVSVARR
jgi:hypothetical protein